MICKQTFFPTTFAWKNKHTFWYYNHELQLVLFILSDHSEQDLKIWVQNVSTLQLSKKILKINITKFLIQIAFLNLVQNGKINNFLRT